MKSFYKLIYLVARYSSVVLISKLISLGATYWLAFKLTNAEFGFISLSQAIFMTSIVLFGFNAQALYVRFGYEYGSGAILKALFPIYLSMMSMAVVACISIFVYYDIESPFVWLCLMPLAGFMASHNISLSSIARVVNNFSAFAISEISRPMLLMIAIAMIIFVPGGEIEKNYSLSLLFAAVLAFLISLFILKRELSVASNPISSGEAIKFVLPLIFVQIVSLGNGVSDRFFLSLWSDIEDLGYYGKAYIIGSSLGLIFDSISILWAPYVVKNRLTYNLHLNKWVGRLFWASCMFAFALVVLSACIRFLNFQFTILVNNDFLVLVALIASAFALRIGYVICVPVLSAFDKTKKVALLSVWSGLAGLVSNIVLIYFFGVYGAAFATLIGFGVFSIGAYFETLRIENEFFGNNAKTENIVV